MLLCPCVWVPNRAERLVDGWHLLEVTGVGLGVSGLCSVLSPVMSELSEPGMGLFSIYLAKVKTGSTNVSKWRENSAGASPSTAQDCFPAAWGCSLAREEGNHIWNTEAGCADLSLETLLV